MSPDTPTGQQVVIPVSANADTPDSAGASEPAVNTDIGSIVGDVFADEAPSDALIGPGEFANFLAFLNDAFVAQLLRDSPSIGGFPSSQSHLERLCIDQGTPEFICRERFGN